MRKLTAQFKLEGELLTANGETLSNDEITEMIVVRLRNRSADFDKIIEDDGDDDIEIQLHDYDLEEVGATQPVTRFDVTFEVEDEVLQKLEMDSDLVFVKVISELENGHVKLVGDKAQDNVSHVSFR